MKRVCSIFVSVPLMVAAQISNVAISPTATQAIIRYTSPVTPACSVRIADMYRNLAIVSATQASGSVTVTTAVQHGLLAGAVVYIENTGVWDGWQTLATASGNTFTFSSAITGSASAGNVGVLVDDVNPALFPGADQDSRDGGASRSRSRVFVAGKRTADMAADGNRYSRALQTNARHHVTITCGSQSFDQEFTTNDLPLGDAHNEPPPVDPSRPGQYAYPTIQWGNRLQALIDPQTGIRSFRATAPVGTPSGTQNFQTAIDSAGVWQNSTAPVNSGGTATFTAPCASGNCALSLRADNLSLPGGATYTADSNSLDWVQVSISNASAPGCSGDDCKLDACLTVNGVSCTSGTIETALTDSPASYTIGTRNLLDLWQGAGPPAIARPDASRATGTVNYSSASNTVTWVSGNPFSIKWGPGSRITVAGSEYTIASVKNENSLTLVSGPAGDLQGAAYSGNNFGVLLWKKTATGQISIGNTTYQYGTSPSAFWGSFSTHSCGPMVTANGVPGYDCFVNQELYWVAQDGSDLRDLGWVRLYNAHPGHLFSDGWACGQSGYDGIFDPTYPDTWYCLQPLGFDASMTGIVMAKYMGPHTAVAPGTQLPDCDVNNNVQPCVKFTPLQPNRADALPQSTVAFSPAYAASQFQAKFWGWGGVSDDGDMMITTRGPQGQDTPGWIFIYALGDRTPAGTTQNSVHPVAAMSTFNTAPLSYCVLHATAVPQGGWADVNLNDLSIRGATWVYQTQLTSAPLTNTPAIPGGLNPCPPNPFGATGLMCTDITVSGDPVRALDGTSLQSIQVGDLMQIDSEFMRVLIKNSDGSLTVQRLYTNQNTAPSMMQHPNTTTLSMACGVHNQLGARNALWNYRADPYGTNSNGNTVLADMTVTNGHGGSGPGIFINAPDGWWDLGQTLCPQALFGSNTACYMIRLGTYATLPGAPQLTVAGDEPFAGKLGIGTPNTVDSHPGPCLFQWCLDARPMQGGQGVGTAASPFVNVGGQLWKATSAQTAGNLNRKFLATMAYVGRAPLVDVSGPGSILGNGPADSYKYCYVVAAGECVSGSAPGELYFNAPYVSVPYCNYPGIGTQGDDTNSVCIGDLGSETGNIVQVGTAREDLQAANSRRLGSMYARWKQHAIYWNVEAPPSGSNVFSQVRWLDGVRNEDIISILPPFPSQDSVTRNTFVPVPVKVTPPTGQEFDNVVVEFGYVENGPANSFFCTSRQESCVAVSTDVDSNNPFYFEQTESYTGKHCVLGCSVTIPALSQHILYYRWKYRDASGKVIATSGTNVVAVP